MESAKDIQERLSLIEHLLNTEPAQADKQAVEFLKAVPGHPLAMLFLGIARRLQGRSESAIEILTPLVAVNPDAPMIHLQLGLALRETGQNEAAIQSMRRAVAVKADFNDGWLALADILTATKDIEGADEAFAMYIRYSTREPHLVQPAAALRENRAADAEALLRKRLAQHPNDIAALCMLADIAERFDQIDEAELLLKRCLELAPGYKRARHNHAVILLRRNKTAAALQETDMLLVDEPRNPELRKLKAAILVRLRDYEESIQICQELLNEIPNQPTVWASLGHMLKSVGRREECITAYRKAIALAPGFGEPAPGAR